MVFCVVVGWLCFVQTWYAILCVLLCCGVFVLVWFVVWDVVFVLVWLVLCCVLHCCVVLVCVVV